MKAKELARCGVMTALLIAVQFALGFVSGVELVTAVFAAYCYVCGVRCGMLTAVAFSLLRCIIFGFSPSVILLYLIYYPLFAAVFGLLAKKSPPEYLLPGLILSACVLSAILGVTGLKISAAYQLRVRVMFWALCAEFAALLVFWAVVCHWGRENGDRILLFNVSSTAAVMTIFFTLLDDVITPLMYRYSREAAAAYFYGGFLAMLPQAVCAVMSVFVLFMPLTAAMKKYGGR